MNINPDGSYSSGPAKKPRPMPQFKLPGKAAVLVLIAVLLVLMVLDAFYTLKMPSTPSRRISTPSSPPSASPAWFPAPASN